MKPKLLQYINGKNQWVHSDYTHDIPLSELSALTGFFALSLRFLNQYHKLQPFCQPPVMIYLLVLRLLYRVFLAISAKKNNCPQLLPKLQYYPFISDTCLFEKVCTLLNQVTFLYYSFTTWGYWLPLTRKAGTLDKRMQNILYSAKVFNTILCRLFIEWVTL